MPCFASEFNNCEGRDIRLRFAWLPITDIDGNSIWLRRYWEYGEWWEFGFYVLRAPKRKFLTKQSFWDYIKYRVASMY